MAKEAVCRHCGEKIQWRTNERGKWMAFGLTLVEIVPLPEYPLRFLDIHKDFIRGLPVMESYPTVKAYPCHFDDCPAKKTTPDSFRGPVDEPDSV